MAKEERRTESWFGKTAVAFVTGMILIMVGIVIIPTVVLAGIGIILVIAGIAIAATSAGSTASFFARKGRGVFAAKPPLKK